MLMDIRRKQEWQSLDQLDFKPKTIIRDEEGHYIILKGSVQQEDLTILNIYAPKVGAANYINQLITKSKKHITIIQ